MTKQQANYFSGAFMNIVRNVEGVKADAEIAINSNNSYYMLLSVASEKINKKYNCKVSNASEVPSIFGSLVTMCLHWQSIYLEQKD